MNHLILGVTKESSLHLLEPYADIILLDTYGADPATLPRYDTVYIRSHFSEPTLTPEYFRTKIEAIVQGVKKTNPDVRFIDKMDTVDAIMSLEDKWHQYQIFGASMPKTELYSETTDVSTFKRPVYKHRLSSNGAGVTWDSKKAAPNDEWIVQESLDIKEELRIYIHFGEVYPIGAVRRSMTEDAKAQAVDSRHLTQDEIEFTQNVAKLAGSLEVIGIDAARTTDGTLQLIEVNRSPGFAKFEELTGVNLAAILYAKMVDDAKIGR